MTDFLVQQLSRVNWSEKYKLYQQVFESYSVVKTTHSPRASIIIISWKYEPAILENLKCLANQGEQGFEVIFVNNGADEEAFRPIRPFINKEIKLNKNTGAYLARNIGAIFSEAPIIIFLDDDAIPADNFVQSHIKMHKQYDIIAVRGPVLPKTPNSPIPAHYYMGSRSFPIYADVEGNTSYSAETFFKVKGWDDEIVFGCGGAELSLRLTQIEPEYRKQIYSAAPIIFHDYCRGEQHLKSKKLKQEESRSRLRAKYPHWDQWLASWRRYFGQSSYIRCRTNSSPLPTKPSINGKSIGSSGANSLNQLEFRRACTPLTILE